MLLLIKDLEDYMLPCFWKKTISIDCMGCGIQRSMAHIIRGEFIDAFYMYPAIYPMLILFVFLIFDCVLKIKHSEKLKLGLAILTLITVVINFILKFY
ncbi:DUF2752 domain-containing protein [uncultured Winogradskyella sp.]|uniref:DUF2752 domain-containing protein n=1 Tax=uncultured Winogradskyella sp. TaxID=395353 RepID=UPI00261DFCA5|nr:DUF2752 domain-containing protein [uncultured Winogradskyella sp.]